MRALLEKELAALAIVYVSHRTRASSAAWSIAIAVFGLPILWLVWIVEPRAERSVERGTSASSHREPLVIQGSAPVATGARSSA